jgi:hypothetical protein
MIYTYFLSLPSKTYAKTYVAKITDSHPKFVFEREFLKKKIIDIEGMRHYFFDIGKHGVFEQCTKVFSKGTHHLISCERKYFVYSRRMQYDILQNEVLHCLFNLKLQYQDKLRKKKAA